MPRPRAVSSADINRSFDCYAKAGIGAESLQVILEPGRATILPVGPSRDELTASTEAHQDTEKPIEWPRE